LWVDIILFWVILFVYLDDFRIGDVKMKDASKIIPNEVRDQAWIQVANQVYWKVGDQVRGHVYFKLRRKIHDER
jgi:hypothetical protein